jgi:hypothetical protein
MRQTGDGYELLNADGEVVAWTLDRIWALKILLALEQLQLQERNETK